MKIKKMTRLFFFQVKFFSVCLNNRTDGLREESIAPNLNIII